jgi:lycopene cyclase domain-containing protein
MPVYLIYLGVFFALPVLALGVLAREDVRRHPRTILWAVGFVAVLGAPWDWLSCRTGVWRYDSAPTVGIWIDGLPVEEFLGFYVLGTLLIVLVSLVALRRTRHV